MDPKFNQFVVFAISIIVLILVLYVSHGLYSYASGKPIRGISTDYKAVNLGEQPWRMDEEDEEAPVLGKGQNQIQGQNLGNKGSILGQMPQNQNIIPGRPYNYGQGRGRDQEQGEVPAADQPANQPSTVQNGPSNALNNLMANLPSFLTTQSSRDESNKKITTPGSSFFSSNAPMTSLITTAMNKLTTSSSFSTTLPSYNYLNKVKVVNLDITANSKTAQLDSSTMKLVNDMQLEINGVRYTMLKVTLMSTPGIIFSSSGYYQVTLDNPVPALVPMGTYLNVYSTSAINASLIATPEAGGLVTPAGGYSITTTMPPTTSTTTRPPTTTPTPMPKRGDYYILHLNYTTTVNSKLYFQDVTQLNIPTALLKNISQAIITTNEPTNPDGSSLTTTSVTTTQAKTTSTTTTPRVVQSFSNMDDDETIIEGATVAQNMQAVAAAVAAAPALAAAPAALAPAAPAANTTTTPTTTTTTTPTTTTTTTDDSGPKKNSYPNNQITCPPFNTSPSSSSGTSVFYVADCVGYPIYDVLWKNNTLRLELDTDDVSMIYSGYYKLVI
jgi:hypothetical protein